MSQINPHRQTYSNKLMNKEKQEQRKADLINRMRARKDWRPSNAISKKPVRWAKGFAQDYAWGIMP